MLVLSRKTDEEIIIGDDIVIKIISVQNGIVKIGFDAPQDKIILRGELKEAIVGENLKASHIDERISSPLSNLGKMLQNQH